MRGVALQLTFRNRPLFVDNIFDTTKNKRWIVRHFTTERRLEDSSCGVKAYESGCNGG